MRTRPSSFSGTAASTGLLLAVFGGVFCAEGAWGQVLLDQGPASGTLGPCFANEADFQEWADQATFPDDVTVTGMVIYTVLPPPPGFNVRIRILADDGAGNPGAVAYQESGPIDGAAAVADDLFAVSVSLGVPFIAPAGETFWYGVAADAGVGVDLAQCSVETPGDGRIARFFEGMFFDHVEAGDQMFELLGVVGEVDAPVAAPTLGHAALSLLVLLVVGVAVRALGRQT
jgi:hypothetical protein